jgi:hypothetical protein
VARPRRGETAKKERRGLAAAIRRRSDDGKSDEPDIKFDTREQSVAAAMGAAVAHILERPDSIRQRAQTAATIASAVVAALVIAAITGMSREQIESWNTSTKVLVVLATVAWIISVVLFVRVVVFAERERTGGESYPEFLPEFQRYTRTLRKRLRLAAWSSTVALVLAVAAVGAEVYELQTSRLRERQLVLSPAATTAVGQLCGHALPAGEVRRGKWTILGKVGTTALSRPLVAVEVMAIVDAQRSERRKPCKPRAPRLARREGGTTVRLPKEAILASAEVRQGKEPHR